MIPRLAAIAGPLKGTIFTLTEEETSIGRESANSVCLADPSVSRRHCVIKREGEKYFLVTPVEKCGIAVDDVPFLAVELYVEQDAGERILHFRTNVDDWVACGPGHPLRFEPEPATGGLRPYIHVRRALWARVTRALFYDLVDLGEERDIAGQRTFGVASAGDFFAMAPAESLKDFV